MKFIPCLDPVKYRHKVCMVGQDGKVSHFEVHTMTISCSLVLLIIENFGF